MAVGAQQQTERCSRRCGVPARVSRVSHPCREHVELELDVTDFPASKPGQFLELLCTPTDEKTQSQPEWVDDRPFALPHTDWTQREAFVRRPFSIADRVETPRGASLSVISRAIGPGTRYLDQLQAGDILDVTGPLGRPFELPNQSQPVLLVGGGVGIPPLLYLARELHACGVHDVTVLFGAMSIDLMPVKLIGPARSDGRATHCFKLPGDAPFTGILTTDDGSAGVRGRVTDAMRVWRENTPSSAAAPLVLACGPEPMLRAIGRLTREFGWDCQLCIEKNMGCGLGTCLSCVVKVVDNDKPDGWRWALSCTEGPVFERDRLYRYCEE